MTDFTISTLSNENFQCAKCKRTTKIFQKNNYVVIACPSCYYIHSKKDTSYSKIPNKWTLKSVLPLYTKGKMGELDLEIIGIALKQDDYEKWIEYQLTDQFGANHIITQWRGHFHYLKLESNTIPEIFELSKICKPNTYDFTFRGRFFNRLSKYTTYTISFIGEFPYDVVDVSKTISMDFTNPPDLISIEHLNDKSEIFVGRYLSIQEIRQIFPDKNFNKPEYGTVGMAQPFIRGVNFDMLRRLMLAFLIGFTFIHIILSYARPELVIFRSSQDTTTDNVEVVSKTFHLENQISSYYLAFYGESRVANQWIENQLTLVNEITGEEREFSLGLEYYSGVDGGYSWSEGSNEGCVCISDVEPGKYHIKQKIISSSPEDHLPFYLDVKISSPSGWNYGLIAISVTILFIVMNIRYFMHEDKRLGSLN